MSSVRVLFGLCLACSFAISTPRTENFAEVPLHFEPNIGQADSAVQFTARTPGMDLYLTRNGTVMVVNGKDAIRMKLPGGKPMAGLQKLPGVSNYFHGNNPKNWRTSVPHYAQVETKDIYPGINLLYYGNSQQIEYDFSVAPGADPNQIQLAFEGPASVSLNEAGDIVLHTPSGDVIQKKPHVYQNISGRKVEIQAKYLLQENRATFDLAQYDRRRVLVIDPVIVYSTYLGSTVPNAQTKIAVDRAGAVYVVAGSSSPIYPTQGEIQSAPRGKSDLVITKLSSAGNTVVYSTYLGGSRYQYPQAVAVDPAGALYLTGSTDSPDFPLKGAFQTTAAGHETAIVVKLTPGGDALDYSTFLGGSGADVGLAIAVDQMGAAYVTGTTTSGDFPKRNALQTALRGNSDGFVAKINPAGSALVFATYLGGSGEERPTGIAIDLSGTVCLGGHTTSADFPLQKPLQQFPSGKRGNSVFVSKLSGDGTALLYSTYVAGSLSDAATALAIDPTGAIYIAGVTNSKDFPIFSSLNKPLKAAGGAFVFKLNPAGDEMVYLSRVAPLESPVLALAVDNAGAAYAVGSGAPVVLVNPIQDTTSGTPDAYLVKINPQGSGLVYSTILGGSAVPNVDFSLGDQATGVAVDSVGGVYVAGSTYRNDFPTYNALFANPFNRTGYTASFVTKISEGTDVRLSRTTINTSGAIVYIDGVIRLDGPQPHTFFWMPGSTHQLAFIEESVNGARTTFVSWSDGGAATHTVTTPANDVTYTAIHGNPK